MNNAEYRNLILSAVSKAEEQGFLDTAQSLENLLRAELHEGENAAGIRAGASSLLSENSHPEAVKLGTHSNH